MDMQWAEVRGVIVNAKRVGSDGSMTNASIVIVKLVEQLYQGGSAQDVGDLGVHLLVVLVTNLSHEHLDDCEKAVHNILGVKDTATSNKRNEV